jgi:tol-pal system protein YbgF
MRRAIAIAGFCLATLGAAVLPAGAAQAREPSPTEIKLDDIDTRLGRVEAVVNNQSLLEMARRIDQLETQLRQLRGAQEEAQNGADSLGRQQRDLYSDLDKRLSLLEARLRPASLSAPPLPSDSPDPVVNSASAANDVPGTASTDDQVAYNRAFETLKSGGYFAAVTRWLEFLKAYPNSKLQDNAQYWLGESYYATHDYDNAMVVFKGLVDRYPDSAKAPDGLLKLGFCQYEKKRLPDARATLKLVQTRYPDSDAARLAGERLAKMGTAGGAATR